MNALKLKSVAVAFMVTLIATVGTSAIAFGSTPGSAKYSKSFIQQKKAINRDLANINQQQDMVNALKQQCRDERHANIKASSVKTDLAKAKADLKRERAYLAADKKELLHEHQALINQRAEDVRAQREEVRETQNKLDADLAEGKPRAVLYAQQVVDAKNELRQREAGLEQAQLSRNSDLLVINKEIRDANGQSAFVLSIEDSYAKTRNMALK